MKRLRLSDIVKVESGAGFPLAYQGEKTEGFPFLKVSDMNLPGNQRAILCWNNSVSEDVRKKLRAKAFPAGSLIFPKIGAAIATNKKRQLTRPSCVDNNVMALVPDSNELDADYLYYLFLTINLSALASDSNPPSIRKSEVEELGVVLPPLPEQRRIVDILSRAEGIVRLRREAEKKAAELIPALFIEMFGDPAANPKGYPVKPLGALVDFISGGTPSKAREDYWVGDVPWVSPKDMKRPAIKDAIDSVNEKIFTETTIKRIPVGAVLIVVRGMILVHSVPIAVSMVPLAINQDMRALIPGAKINGVFLLELLRILKSHLLGMVSTAAHGTKRIETEALRQLRIVLPPIEEQMLFSEQVNRVNALQTQQAAAAAKAQASFDALLAQAFPA